MMTRPFRLASVVAILSSSACASTGPTIDAGGDFGTLRGSKVEITAEGGIAALSVSHRIEHDTRKFTYVQGRLCGSSCGAPLDSASGILTPAVDDSVFNIVLEQAHALSKDDYGQTQNGADMMVYTIRVTSDGHLRTLRGDDGTLPGPARLILSTVREAISTARGR